MEKKIIKDMETEGKIMKVLIVILVIAFIFACGYMSA
jgi:hypothetical protein